MSDPRVIKKYPNRRLYDTVESRYITLADVRRLVVERIDFVVVDKKNNADITRSILLQVIAEQEHLPEPILTQDFMVNVIRSYGSSVQGPVSGHLEQTLKQYLSQHQPVARSRQAVRGEPKRRRARTAGGRLSRRWPRCGCATTKRIGEELEPSHQMTQRSVLTMGLEIGNRKRRLKFAGCWRACALVRYSAGGCGSVVTISCACSGRMAPAQECANAMKNC